MTEQEWLTSSDPAVMLSCLRGQSYAGYIGPDELVARVSDRKLLLWAAAVCRAALPGGWREANRDADETIKGLETWAETGKDAHIPEDKWNAQGHAVRDTPAGVARFMAGWGERWGVGGGQKAALLREVCGNPFQPRFEFSDIEPEGHTWDVNRGNLYILPKHWLTPTVVALATAAYQGQQCPECKGKGQVSEPVYAAVTKTVCGHCGGRLVSREGGGCQPGDKWCERCWGVTSRRCVDYRSVTCPACHGVRVNDGVLDPVRLAVLADALSDSGCDNEDVLRHLRDPGPHVVGCWVIDTLIDRE